MFEKAWKKILRRQRFSFLAIPAFFLWLVSFVYRFAVSVRRSASRVRVRVDVPVISVGNIAVGGTGKTPMVGFLARFLLDEGYRVAVVSSGYGRRSSAPILEPGYRLQNVATDDVGDEVKLLADLLPDAVFAVDKVKAAAVKRVAAGGDIDVIIVDDGFQHFQLHRDIDIVTYDAGVRRGLLKPFPYGVLREPPGALRRADIIVITRAKFAKDLHRLQTRLRAINPQAQHYHARFSASDLLSADQSRSVKYLEDKSVFLFAGVGNFRSVRRQVAALCADLDCALELSDHQRYDIRLLKRIKSLADKYDSDVILTTAKDRVKIEDFDFDREFYYLNQVVDLDPGEEKLIFYLVDKLGIRRRAD
ncbi:MAG: tetraacyldisaccharide 4'-kinase [Candidatus Zixiibacteriota bacterium]|nr:MAG: tetraacyldisaccharide 4'-kinase [candidate division Zixibacteria bacterium]